MEPWLENLRAAFDDAFLTRDWREHVRRLNTDLRLGGTDALAEVDRPPEYFWGDLDALIPGEWVAVVSLNPQLAAPVWDGWYAAQQWDAQSYWDYLNRRDLRTRLDGTPFEAKDYYYVRFVRALVNLAGAALNIPDPRRDEVAIAMRRMAFFEILPYPSKSYVPRPTDAVRLVKTDLGCQIATRAMLGAIEHRKPAVVLVNGSDAVHVFEAVHGIEWTEHRYPSASSTRAKMLRHFESTLRFGSYSVPMFGFPQLRTMSSHNSNAEVAQLGDRIAEVVGR